MLDLLGYKGIIHSETPQAGFPKLPDVQRLAARPGWRLLQHADHCSNTCELDGTFPKKPSCYLVYNIDPHLTLAQCHNDCPHRLAHHPTRHKLLICQCPNARQVGQRVLRSMITKAKVPMGVFRSLWNARRIGSVHAAHDSVFSAVYRHRRSLTFVAMSCAWCHSLTSVDSSAHSFTCCSCDTTQASGPDMCFALDELNDGHSIDVHADPAPERTYHENKPDRQLLHERFAHAHVEWLTGVRSKHPLPTNLRPSCPCRTCMMTRQAEKPRSSAQLHDAPRAAPRLDRVNVDLHGPYLEESFGQYWYVAVFVDSCTGHLHVTRICSKADTLDALQEYVQCVGKPRTLTHDRGTEFAGAFQNYCWAHAINVLRTEGYAPWRNGRVERAN